MSKELLTPELIDWLKASVRMLNGNFISEDEFISKINEIGEMVSTDNVKVAVLSPLEAEAIYLDICCAVAANRKMEAFIGILSNKPNHNSEIPKIFYANTLQEQFGRLTSMVMLDVVAKNAAEQEKFEKGDCLSLAFIDDALCLCRGKSTGLKGKVVPKIKLSDDLKKTLSMVDLENWKPEGRLPN